MGSRLAISLPALVVLTLGVAVLPASGQEEPEDATSVSINGTDPLAWIGSHEVLFLGRVMPGGAELRAGPDPHYRMVRRLAEGSLVVVVKDAPGHVGVVVPEGFTAYIHGRYVNVNEDDIGIVTASRVNVRAAPSSGGNFPIGQVDVGTMLRVWGPASDGSEWLQITAPGDLVVWAADAAVAIAGDLRDDPSLLDEIARLRRQRERAFEERSPEAMAKADARRREALAPGLANQARQLLDTALHNGEQADFAAARELISEGMGSTRDPKLAAVFQAMSREIEAHEALRRQAVERETLLQQLEEERGRLAAAKAEAEKRARDVAYGGELPETGEIGVWHGFVRERLDDVNHPFALEQGTRVIAWLECGSRKFRLADFRGKQVKISGRVSQVASAPVVDLVTIEIVRR